MTQINNPTGIDKVRPNKWRIDEESARYFRELELFIRQVYENATGIGQARSYTVSTLPSASDLEASYIYVSDETGGATLAFSDGTNWRRVQDRAVVS